jgi:hypothetical protein
MSQRLPRLCILYKIINPMKRVVNVFHSSILMLRRQAAKNNVDVHETYVLFDQKTGDFKSFLILLLIIIYRAMR